MRGWTVAIAIGLIGVAGSAAGAQGTPPNLSVNTAEAVNACIPSAEQQVPIAQVSPARRRGIVACIFATTAEQINRQLPTQVDAMTRLDRITVSGAELTYHYSVSRRLAELPPNVQEFIESGTRASACGQANMRQTMDMGGSYVYRWLDPDGREIHHMTISGC